VIAIVIVAIIIIVVILVAVIARSQGLLCFADNNVDEDGKKTAAQFEALEKGDDIPEKEPIKEANDIIKEPVINATEPKTETVNEKTEIEEKNNGNHTPV
jgi:membrane-associated protease RseP (regulator of RpoE activity)